MREFVARENIRRFEEQLASCEDPERRQTLETLLQTERERLAQAIAEDPATQGANPADRIRG